MADWGGLPGGVVALFAKRLQLIEDLISFRSTCSSWRKATSLADFDKSCPRLPLVLLDYYAYDIDKKSPPDNLFGSSYDSDRADEFDESDQDIEAGESDEVNEESDHESDEESEIDDENHEIIAEEVNYENVMGEENDEITKSNGNRENSEMDDENHEIVESRNYENDDDTEERMFFSLSKGKGCMISLPEARGMECIGSKGWLIMVNRFTGDMCLFHPLTRARITLLKAPSEVKFPIYPKHIRCAVLSASPSETSDYVVMVAYVHQNYISGSCVVFWKPGNLTWTSVELEAPARCVEDLTYYNGKFYALTWRCEVWMCDISGPNPINNAVKIIELP